VDIWENPVPFTQFCCDPKTGLKVHKKKKKDTMRRVRRQAQEWATFYNPGSTTHLPILRPWANDPISVNLAMLGIGGGFICSYFED